MEPNSQGKPGVYFKPGDNTRLAGKMQVHERMRFDESGHPKMQVFNTCTEFIRTIPTLPYSMTKVEDVDTDAEDHCLAGDTMVLTDAGWVPIKNMPSSGKVMSHDGFFHDYADCRKTQEGVSVFKLILENGLTVTATKNHRFMMADGTWKRLDELQPGDDLAFSQ